MTTVAEYIATLSGLSGATFPQHVSALSGATGSTIAEALAAYSGLASATLPEHLAASPVPSPVSITVQGGYGREQRVPLSLRARGIGTASCMVTQRRCLDAQVQGQSTGMISPTQRRVLSAMGRGESAIHFQPTHRLIFSAHCDHTAEQRYQRDLERMSEALRAEALALRMLGF
jgi:hypothetical protein